MALTKPHVIISNEPCHEKTGFLHYAKTKTQISFAVAAKLITAFVFAIWIVQCLLGSTTYMQIRNFKPLAISCGCTAPLVSDLVGNPEDWFSHNEAQIVSFTCLVNLPIFWIFHIHTSLYTHTKFSILFQRNCMSCNKEIRSMLPT